MEWSEEKYVKLYVRDTVTWLSWPWQAKALWPLLMRKLDGAGMLECGNTHPAKAVSLVVAMPLEVVEAGLVAILESGTLEKVPNGLLAPKFLEGQEARKSDALRQREARARRREDIVSRKPAESGGSASHGVTRRHETSQPVTLQPSPAQPSPELLPPRKRDGRAKKPPNPNWQPTIQALETAFKDATGHTYRFSGGADGSALSRLLASETPEEILRRWRVGLKREGWHHTATVAQLAAKWNDLATGPPTKSGAPIDPLTQGHRTEGPITATEVQL